ncbi:MAG TPA: hypothetical protein VOA88_19765 [Candidatus Dormibacteraeota bacterium]|nr:hypothetical protein [Candidatus Dormibacteraeota bacterium]
MKEPSIGTKLVVASGFFMSAGALYWLVASPPRPRELLFRIGYVSAVFCAVAVLSFCWAAFVADLALKRGWSPRTCIKAGAPLCILVLVWGFADSRFWLLVPLVGLINVVAGFFARRIAYPNLTDEEAAAPEPPLSLFQK